MIANLFFFLFAFVLLGSAVATLSARQPVHAVLFLILAFFNAAGLLLTLGAEFLAFILLIVYVGAVAVLFLFVVMMLDVRAGPPLQPLRRFGKTGLAVAAVLGAQMISLAVLWPATPVAEQAGAAVSDTQMLGRALYTQFMLAFQISGLVLLVAIIGAIALAHGPRRAVKRQKLSEQIGLRREDVVKLHDVKIGEGIQ